MDPSEEREPFPLLPRRRQGRGARRLAGRRSVEWGGSGGPGAEGDGADVSLAGAWAAPVEGAAVRDSERVVGGAITWPWRRWACAPRFGCYPLHHCEL